MRRFVVVVLVVGVVDVIAVAVVVGDNKIDFGVGAFSRNFFVGVTVVAFASIIVVIVGSSPLIDFRFVVVDVVVIIVVEFALASSDSADSKAVGRATLVDCVALLFIAVLLLRGARNPAGFEAMLVDVAFDAAVTVIVDANIGRVVDIVAPVRADENIGVNELIFVVVDVALVALDVDDVPCASRARCRDDDAFLSRDA